MKSLTCYIIILLPVLTSCDQLTTDLKTLVFANNPWEYRTTSQQTWQKGLGAIGEGYDSIPTNSIYYRTHFITSQPQQGKKYLLEINLQGDYLIYLNEKKLAEIELSQTSFDTTNIKNNSKVFRKTRRKIRQIIPINKSHIKDGLNELTIELKKVDIIMDYPVRISLRKKVYKQNIKKKSTNRLPVICINTFGKTIPDEPKIRGILEIKTDTGVLESFIGIEIRGHTSQAYPKKSFGFETRDSAGNNNNISLLGLPKENDWILYAPYVDKTLMRNVLAYDIFREMGHYSVRTRFCNLYLNNKYEGIFVLTEKIKRDKSRVDVSKFSSDDFTGGYIIANDRSSSKNAFNSMYHHDYEHQTPYYIIYPDSANLTVQHKKYAKNLFHDFEQSVLDNSGDYANYIDIKSFTDYLLLSELSRNHDAYRLSTFYYKNKDSVDPKIYMGPVWDYNLAFGMANYARFYYFEGWVYEQNKNMIPFWWDNLIEDPDFNQHLKSRWKELRTGVLSDDALANHIDSTALFLYPSIRKNFKRWPILQRDTYPCFYNGPTYLDNVDYLKFWILNRARWMDENI